MERDEKIKQEVEQTMRSLDGIQPAKTDDFFYSRLETRLQNRNDRTTRWVLTPELTFALAAAFILILVNIFTVLKYNQNFGDVESSRQDYLEAFAEEYELDIPTIYEMNSEE